MRLENSCQTRTSLTQAFLYPGVGLLETTNLSVGRGTDTPFEVIGAPWVDGRSLAVELNALELPGIAFVGASYRGVSLNRCVRDAYTVAPTVLRKLGVRFDAPDDTVSPTDSAESLGPQTPSMPTHIDQQQLEPAR